MSVLAKEESSNAAFVSSINAINQSTPEVPLPPKPKVTIQEPPATINSIEGRFPASATKVKLNSILSHNNNQANKK
jgi:hypothetical protein